MVHSIALTPTQALSLASAGWRPKDTGGGRFVLEVADGDTSATYAAMLRWSLVSEANADKLAPGVERTRVRRTARDLANVADAILESHQKIQGEAQGQPDR